MSRGFSHIRSILRSSHQEDIKQFHQRALAIKLFWSFLQVLHENLKKLGQFFQVSVHIHTSA